MIDSHCHFDFDVFDHCRSALWQRCNDIGVNGLLIPGIEPQQWQKAAALCDEYKGFYYAAGLHPWWLDREASIQPLAQSLSNMIGKQLEDEKCVAIGECGLDKPQATDNGILSEASWQQQLDTFQAHIDIAKQYSYPIIIHSVKAHAEVLSALKATKLDAGGVIHAFTGSKEIAKQYWQLGFYLGIGGVITYERARKTRDAVKALPMEALLLETDAPSMPLSGHQGKDNSPENLPLIAKEFAKLKGITEQEVAEQSTQNFYDLFRLKGC